MELASVLTVVAQQTSENETALAKYQAMRILCVPNTNGFMFSNAIVNAWKFHLCQSCVVHPLSKASRYIAVYH